MKSCRSECNACTINIVCGILKNTETRNVYDTYGDVSTSLMTCDNYHNGFITLCNNKNLFSLLFVICLVLVGIILSDLLNIRTSSRLILVIGLAPGIFLLGFSPANRHKMKCIGYTTNLCRMLKVNFF